MTKIIELWKRRIRKCLQMSVWIRFASAPHSLTPVKCQHLTKPMWLLDLFREVQSKATGSLRSGAKRMRACTHTHTPGIYVRSKNNKCHVTCTPGLSERQGVKLKENVAPRLCAHTRLEWRVRETKRKRAREKGMCKHIANRIHTNTQPRSGGRGRGQLAHPPRHGVEKLLGIIQL